MTSLKRFATQNDLEVLSSIKGVLVTARKGNFAEKMYKEVLGVTEQACIENYGSGNELILYRSSI